MCRWGTNTSPFVLKSCLVTSDFQTDWYLFLNYTYPHCILWGMWLWFLDCHSTKFQNVFRWLNPLEQWMIFPTAWALTCTVLAVKVQVWFNSWRSFAGWGTVSRYCWWRMDTRTGQGSGHRHLGWTSTAPSLRRHYYHYATVYCKFKLPNKYQKMLVILSRLGNICGERNASYIKSTNPSSAKKSEEIVF